MATKKGKRRRYSPLLAERQAVMMGAAACAALSNALPRFLPTFYTDKTIELEITSAAVLPKVSVELPGVKITITITPNEREQTNEILKINTQTKARSKARSGRNS